MGGVFFGVNRKMPSLQAQVRGVKGAWTSWVSPWSLGICHRGWQSLPRKLRLAALCVFGVRASSGGVEAVTQSSEATF